jgi:hypothetical protein
MEKRILELALEALQAQKQAIEAEIEQLNGGIKVQAPQPGSAAPGRRTRSAAQRKAHSERMKAIWAARKTKSPKTKAAKAAGKSSNASAANKARADKMRAYWASRRKEKAGK